MSPTSPQARTPTLRSPVHSPPHSPSQRPTSPPNSSPSIRPLGSSRTPSTTSRRDQFFTPLHPSHLRQSTLPSSSPGTSPNPHGHFTDPFTSQRVPPMEDLDQPNDGEEQMDEHTRLVHSSGRSDEDGYYNKHIQRPKARRSYGSFQSYITDGGWGDERPEQDENGGGQESGIDEVLQRRSTSITLPNWTGLGKGKRGRKRRIYIAYYIPMVNWIQQYKWSYLRGDFIAAVTMASFYIPMALSLASNLGHVPPMNGLYAFVFNPLIYAILGSCPQMVVGPEAAGSLLTGQVVKENINKGHVNDDDGVRSAQIGGMVTFTAGFVILLSGLFRLGFLDNVLSRPFQRGFISAIGIVIFIDQLIPELGLQGRAAEVGGVLHGSCVDKIIFLVQHVGEAHGLTTALSLGAFAVTMICREIKHRLQGRYPNMAYVPDRFVVVFLSALLCWRFRWDLQGVPILGEIKTDGKIFPIHWPLSGMHMKYASDAFGTSFIIALLGFFESSVAAKSLGVGEKSGAAIQNMHLSANRELVALGTANVVGGLFMALPAFGGYGRSKVNASTGGKTPMSSIFLSLITLICVLFVTPYFYYLPKGVLSSMISVVAYSLLEEIPEDLFFFIRIRGYSELLLMSLIFVSTIFWNLKMGIAVGIGLSLLRVIRHATRPRIQILGRVHGTADQFEDAEWDPGNLEFFEGCLIVRVPEPLTFANTGSLRARLQRLENYGANQVHPSMPPMRRKEHNQNIIFDIHGVTSLDGAGAQVLRDIVKNYVQNGVKVIFCRTPSERSEVWRLLVDSGVVEMVGGRDMFVSTVQEALALTEFEGSGSGAERA